VVLEDQVMAQMLEMVDVVEILVLHHKEEEMVMNLMVEHGRQ
tara:strand:+ start:390 stop:515 length:126 start_codon:yes stop_codon:yes gene_type:complete